MLAAYAFVVLSAILAFFALMIFKSKRLLHAVLALTGVFFMSSMILLLFGQALAALLQLIILVGGMSTYLIVAVASDSGEEKKMHGWIFALVFALLFAALMPMALFLGSGYYLASGSGNFISAAANDLGSYPYLFFIIALLVAASSIGSVVLIRKVVRLMA